MKYVLLGLLLMTGIASCAQKQRTKTDEKAAYFKEIKAATQNHNQLWDMNLYAPILLVDRQTRQVYANEPDTADILKPNGNIYTGGWPQNLSMANTALQWNGKRWAMIMLPLPEDKENRINLMTHELFHRAQPALGFTLSAANNNHLAKKDGRIYLKLELEALKKALRAGSNKELHKHLANAFTFRKYRHSLYPESKKEENNLEINEGLAEFTGVMMSGRNQRQMVEHLVQSINDFYKNPTFVRSFAYETIPVYGYLLYGKDVNWPGDITNETNLTDYFIKAFQIEIPDQLKNVVDSLARQYNGQNIMAEETATAEKTQKRIAAYRKKLIEQPHFEIPIMIDLKKLSVAFDPRTIMPLGDAGTVYPSIRVTDLWGILKVEKNGVLITSGWTKISLTNPVKIEKNKIIGNGWTIELNDGYAIEKNEAGNYRLVKK